MYTSEFVSHECDGSLVFAFVRPSMGVFVSFPYRNDDDYESEVFLDEFLSLLFFQNGSTAASFLFIFDLFKQTSLEFLQHIYVKKCPSILLYQDSNPRPS